MQNKQSSPFFINTTHPSQSMSIVVKNQKLLLNQIIVFQNA